MEQSVREHIKNRIELEKNDSLRAKGVDQYGDPVVIRKRFWHLPDCRNAYRSYICWINFPRCWMLHNESLAICRSACENYFISCGLERNIWRCGASLGSFDSNEPVERGGIYVPDNSFPDDEIHAKGSSRKICTPALEGGAVGRDGHGLLLLWVVGAIAVVCLLR